MLGPDITWYLAISAVAYMRDEADPGT